MDITIKKINHVHVCIPFGQEETARVFYSKILGFKEIEKPLALKKNGGLWFEVADIQFHVGVEDFENKSKSHPAFEVENLEQVRQYLSTHNIQIKDEVQIPNQIRFSFRDPFGNRIEFLEKI